MSNGAAALASMSTLDDDAWDDLLSFIEEKRVIPIVGPELLLVSTDRGPRLLLDGVGLPDYLPVTGIEGRDATAELAALVTRCGSG